MAILKRSREEYETSLAMANYLIMLSQAPRFVPETRVFECKTCNRKFPSFQALGGHRASHKKPRLGSEASHDDHHDQVGQSHQGKAKTHECSICGLEFAIGQALGGHMRRHRAALSGSRQIPRTPLSLSDGSDGLVHQNRKKGGNGKRVKCLDLNLTPLENGLLDTGILSPVLC